MKGSCSDSEAEGASSMSFVSSTCGIVQPVVYSNHAQEIRTVGICQLPSLGIFGVLPDTDLVIGAMAEKRVDILCCEDVRTPRTRTIGRRKYLKNPEKQTLTRGLTAEAPQHANPDEE